MYVCYPMIITALLAFTDKDIHENWQIAIFFALIPIIVEVIQILNDGKKYFNNFMNILDFFGLIFISTFLFSHSSLDQNNVYITFLLIGLGLSYYRGFKSLCIFFDRFMVSFMTLLRSLFSLKMFALVILAQIFLFAVMNSI